MYTTPSLLDTPLDHPLRRGPGVALSRLFAKLEHLRHHAHHHHREDQILLSILHELEEIEVLLQHLTRPHGAIVLDLAHSTVTAQPSPGDLSWQRSPSNPPMSSQFLSEL